MNFEIISNKNYLLFCMHHYENPQCSGTDEFFEDLKRIKYIKKLITRYQETGELKERLILNHLIILNNVFGPKILNRIIFFKLRTQLKYIKPFLILLNILPEKVDNIYTDEIIMDQNIVNALRKI